MAEEPARVAWRSYHDWVLPVKAVQVLLAGALLFLFLGLVLLATGGAVHVAGLVAAGAVLSGLGGCGLLICLLLCMHAYFIFNVRDQANQTPDTPWSDEVLHSPSQEIPGYAVISKPSALKAGDTFGRNSGGGTGDYCGAGGVGGTKKVTMAPDVALDADFRAPAQRTGPGTSTRGRGSHHVASPASSGYRALGSYAVLDDGEGLGSPGGRAASRGSAATMESFDQRSFAQHQSVRDVHQPRNQQQVSQQQAFSQKQRADTDIQQQRQQLEMHRQHLMQQQQHKQQQQQQQQQQHQHFRLQVQQPQPSSVGYGQVPRHAVQHSPSPSMSSQQSSVFTSGSVSGGAGGGISQYGTGTSSMGGMGSYLGTGTSFGGSPIGTAKTSSSFSSYKIQTQGLHYQSGRPYSLGDGDYDNPAESTPMIAGPVAAPPQQMSAASKGVSFSGSVANVQEADVPEPTPLQHPSQRRPMTFEQQSSSKMSIYDNVLFPYAETEGE